MRWAARGVGGPIGGHDEREQTLNQLLTEMDGFDSSVGLIILAATNRPEILDQALLRAGRFDRQVLVDRPDKKGRLDILKVHVKKVTLAESTQARIDQAIRDIVMGVFERAYRILDTNRAVLERCAREPLARETLDENDILQLTQGLVLDGNEK